MADNPKLFERVEVFSRATSDAFNRAIGDVLAARGPMQLLYRLSRIVLLGLVLYTAWLLITLQPDLARRMRSPVGSRLPQQVAAHQQQVQTLLRSSVRSRLLGLHTLVVLEWGGGNSFQVLAAYGRIDGLVNNAGIAPRVRADITAADEASFDEVLAVNLRGPYFLTQLVARWWLAHPGEARLPGGYTLVFVTSISAHTASVARGDYCIAKAGLSMARELWAVRLADAGVNVYEVRPGIMKTDMTAGVTDKYDALIAGGLVPQGRWGTGDDVGRASTASSSSVNACRARSKRRSTVRCAPCRHFKCDSRTTFGLASSTGASRKASSAPYSSSPESRNDASDMLPAA